MVVDKFENLEKYASLNPLFAEAIKFLKTTDLNAQELGKIKLQGDDLVVNFSQTNPKTKEEAKLETHNRFIDIQIPLSGVEVMGYTPREDLPEAEYNADKDISFYHGLAETNFTIKTESSQLKALNYTANADSAECTGWREKSNRKSIGVK